MPSVSVYNFLIDVTVLFLLLNSFVTYSESKKSCPLRVCYKPCASGYRFNKDGCMNCLCVDPCENVVCDRGETCKAVQYPCISTPCYLEPKCVSPCPKKNCARSCDSGYKKDSKGCYTCTCLDPCENSPCKESQLCQSSQSMCKGEVCYTSAQCLSFCPKLDCTATTCSSGYKKDADGCKICSCADACEEMICDQGTSCRLMVNPTCNNEKLCYPVAICTEIKCDVNRTVKCPIQCPGGFKRDKDDCEVCECKDPCDVQKDSCKADEVCQNIKVYCPTAKCNTDFGRCVSSIFVK
ncbi:hypothetical protein HELRODRAFT_170607 [Helobdella robusta]|uniref:Antistasin-like domain-containing protein n=1 Tax=Helobdella robusta TaxID=6412 RepID=T1F384_HELRO|nr:hypothetical protein HELRODRAFT_170607 [Helobdella robusta]ESO07278.1 hypothetical protein HELRODRAFT_170607 [Helobdella robusta]